ncbi:MAG: tRNA (adenosine(37)-N6)-threonylcarbamoyltransferase complex dimerization subunit type 1 TsaB [SAR202 cluster bacterium]|nr:tRNA (adenosine(37)-N6)-threonylcarbamoyltransferase complex dimerization subunit type 1 TsaB [SAR202 cluster bacterium]
MELSIDTSTGFATVAVSDGGRIVSETTWRAGRNHSVDLAPTLLRTLSHAGVAISDIAAIFVAMGPGGFSALRVGMSLAKSLAMARSIPLLGISTLEVEAAPYLGLGSPVCAILDAGRGLFYVARYNAAGNSDGEYAVQTLEDLSATVVVPTVICGEDAAANSAEIRRRLGGRAIVSAVPPPTRRAAVLAMLGHRSLAAGRADDPAALQPIYMRGSQFEAAQKILGR